MAKKQPAQLQMLKGVDKKNPDRINKNEPQGGKIGNPPAHFSKELKSVWKEFVDNLVDGVLQKSDRQSLEIACHLMFQFRQNPVDFSGAKLSRLHSLLGSFGMTPSDRRNISVPDKKPENPFDKFK